MPFFCSGGGSRRLDHRIPSPGPPSKYRKHSDSPLLAEKFKYSRSPSPPLNHRNGGRNGHKSRSPEKAVERRRRSGSRAPVREI